MITIEKYPRLGTYGWRAVITVGGRQRDILRVGTRHDIERAAREVESALRGQGHRHLLTEPAHDQP